MSGHRNNQHRGQGIGSRNLDLTAQLIKENAATKPTVVNEILSEEDLSIHIHNLCEVHSGTDLFFNNYKAIGDSHNAQAKRIKELEGSSGWISVDEFRVDPVYNEPFWVMNNSGEISIGFYSAITESFACGQPGGDYCYEDVELDEISDVQRMNIPVPPK